MFHFVSTPLLLRIVNSLLNSHSMARQLATNTSAQRNLLWKATFKGRSKPNLQKLEGIVPFADSHPPTVPIFCFSAHSMHCALNILFQLYAQNAIQPDLLNQLREQLQRSLLPHRVFLPSLLSLFPEQLAMPSSITCAHIRTLFGVIG